MIGLKGRNDFYFSAESTFQESVSKQNFYACARAKIRDIIATFPFIPCSVKPPLTNFFSSSFSSLPMLKSVHVWPQLDIEVST